MNFQDAMSEFYALITGITKKNQENFEHRARMSAISDHNLATQISEIAERGNQRARKALKKIPMTAIRGYQLAKTQVSDELAEIYLKWSQAVAALELEQCDGKCFTEDEWDLITEQRVRYEKRYQQYLPD